jgi:hypothetical protein
VEHRPSSCRDSPRRTRLTVSGGVLYFTQTGAQTVSSVPVTGGPPAQFASGFFSANGLAVADGLIYVADSFNSRIATVPIGGGTPTTLVDGLTKPFGLVVV